MGAHRLTRASHPRRRLLVVGPARHRRPARVGPGLLGAATTALVLTAFMAGTATATPLVVPTTAGVTLTACAGAR